MRMRIVQINCTYSEGSTGKIVAGLHNYFLNNNLESYVLYSDGKSNVRGTHKYMNKFERILFSISSHLFGHFGFEGKIATKRIIKFIKRVQPDIVQIHNIHSHNCNFKLLFDYLSSTNIKICYSLHDCWPVTGYCAHFISHHCDKWMSECSDCKVYKKYSYFFDESKSNFRKKKSSLIKCNKLYLIFASEWIKNIVSNSFLAEKYMEVIPNGINQNVFCPKKTNNFADIFSKEKINIIGVAYNFTESKGIQDFIKLSQITKNFCNIILVGNINEKLVLPSNIIHVCRQNNQELLAELFSSADIFLNLTKEETFGLTNIESLSCGTPVITYKSGGSPETVDDSCGAVVECGDFDCLIKEIKRFGKKTDLQISKCINRSKLYSEELMCKNYLNFYFKILNL